ncbi:CRISP/Allergen/PR-1-like isoform X2 [Macrobrachium rosenbergii]|uniref:CRISP/Allergen/PR-1-like isoform X2 n=1 Tax=Macrobrachium rosenbergii TaxID=79674 RepID=UPI0034D69BEF
MSRLLLSGPATTPNSAPTTIGLTSDPPVQTSSPEVPTTHSPTTVPPTELPTVPPTILAPANPPTTLVPTTGKPPTTVEPTTSKPPTTVEPTTSKPPTTVEPTTTKPPTTVEPTTTKPPTTVEPTTTKPPTTVEPTTTKPPTTVEPTTTKPPTTVEPTTSKPPTPTAPTCDYSQFGSTHTMLLPPKATCTAHLSGVTDADKAIILATHNNHRVTIAKGLETRGAPGPQPAGANIRELVWNDELAKVAQAWASQCPSGHDGGNDRKICSRSYAVGQNIYYYWGFDDKTAWKNAIDAWYEEVADMPSTMVDSFTSSSANGKVIGHYTQVVWAKTNEIGCGGIHYSTTLNGVTYPQSKIYVCNYGEAGNFLTRPVYVRGTAASQCPNGGAASATYPELCA